jgi:hypothetical protein
MDVYGGAAAEREEKSKWQMSVCGVILPKVSVYTLVFVCECCMLNAFDIIINLLLPLISPYVIHKREEGRAGESTRMRMRTSAIHFQEIRYTVEGDSNGKFCIRQMIMLGAVRR